MYWCRIFFLILLGVYWVFFFSEKRGCGYNFYYRRGVGIVFFWVFDTDLFELVSVDLGFRFLVLGCEDSLFGLGNE